MAEKKLLAAIAIVMAVAFMASFALGSAVYCRLNDDACLQRAVETSQRCIPGTIRIEWGNETDYFVLSILLRREGVECMITEKIDLVKGNPQDLPSGFTEDLNCSFSIANGETGCEGSFMNQVKQKLLGGGGGGADGPQGAGANNFVCTPENFSCRSDSIYCIQNCIDATILDTEHKWYPISYWTKYIAVRKDADGCRLHFEIINATDLPGDIPPGIVGMKMDCIVPGESVPFQSLQSEWCEGPLFDYLREL